MNHSLVNSLKKFFLLGIRSRTTITVIGCSLLAFTLFIDRGLVVIERIAPSGSDPGNWLTFAWELGGKNIRLAQWAYPPLFPLILRGFLYFINPMGALKLAGLLCWVLVGISFFLSVRAIFPNILFLVQFGLALLVMCAGYQGEIYAWGGYPQLLGLAFLTAAIPFSDRWINCGKQHQLVFSALMVSGVIYTHHLLSAIQMVMLAILFAWNIIAAADSTDRFTKIKRMVLLLSLSLIFSFGAIPSYIKYFSLLGVNPTNPGGFSFSSLSLMISYVFQDSILLWMVLIIFCIGIALMNRKKLVARSVIVFLITPVLLLPVLWEVRILQIIFVGIGYGLSLSFDHVQQVRSGSFFNRALNGLMIIILSLELLLSLPNNQTWFQKALNYYQVVDEETYEGLYWLKFRTNPGDRVLASRWNNYNIGWWVEGFDERPSIYAFDLRWLVFKQERLYANQANTFFEGRMTVEEMETFAKTRYIRWILVDKTSVSPEVLHLYTSSSTFVPAFDNNRLSIYKVLP